MEARSHDANWRARRNRARPGVDRSGPGESTTQEDAMQTKIETPYKTAAALIAKLTRHAGPGSRLKRQP